MKEEKEIEMFKKEYEEMLKLILKTQNKAQKMEDTMKGIIEEEDEEVRNELVKWVEETTQKILQSNEITGE